MSYDHAVGVYFAWSKRHFLKLVLSQELDRLSTSKVLLKWFYLPFAEFLAFNRVLIVSVNSTHKHSMENPENLETQL